jgi:predicted AAA+ superfamily ATPase
MERDVEKVVRYLKMELPKKQSAFLWGPRKTGKSTFLKDNFKDAIYYDLLLSEVFLEFLQDPSKLRRQLLAQNCSSMVIIDEVQKIPALLDEVHWLIENTDYQFILCGSNAAKIRRIGSNLMGGRAWKYSFFPLIYKELPAFDLIRIFNNGTIPSHYFSPNIKRSFDAYTADYLTLEIAAEGLTRNLPFFANFLRIMSFSVCEMLNYNNIARECGIDVRTVQSYFQILYDSMIGYYIMPYSKSLSRKEITSTPKFYLFDTGFMSRLKKITFEELSGAEAGKALENYIFCEINAYKELNNLDFEINYWRTKSGHEVDFVLDHGSVTIEVKITQHPSKEHMKNLVIFAEECGAGKLILVCNISKKEVVEMNDKKILIVPIEEFLEELWNGEII